MINGGLSITSPIVIRNAAQMLTIPDNDDIENLGIIQNGAIVIESGNIVWIGETTNIDDNITLSENTRFLDAAGAVVMPGLIDSHTHLIFGGSRENEFEMRIKGVSYQEIAISGGGIKSTVTATRKASKETLYEIGKNRLDSMLSLGVTTAEAKSGYGLSTKEEIKILEVIKELNDDHPVKLIPTFLGAHEIPEEYQGKKEKYIDLIRHEMIPQVVDGDLAKFCDVFCEDHVFNLEESKSILNTASDLGLRPKVHADQLTPLGGATIAAEVGALSADHLECITEEGISNMRKKNVVAGLLPGATFFLGLNNYAPARKLLENGIRVAIATDFNPGSCMSENLPLMMTIACTQMQMSPAEVIRGVTLNAAYSIGMEHSIGNLEVGKSADIVILAVPDYRFLPYHFAHSHVQTVIKKGEIVWKNDDRKAKSISFQEIKN